MEGSVNNDTYLFKIYEKITAETSEVNNCVEKRFNKFLNEN